ncbi:terminase large subunit [Bradyrhizobium sp. HKCCYLRH3099]|uniref:terminase large subunit n=1 Tax=unclassified Bradyrhizobium TaxID=2631580 RepID=UPI003EB961AB
MWDLSCVDWADRLRDGRSLVPDLPLIDSEAEMGLAIFDELQLPDVPGTPRLGEAAGPWFRDIVRAAFGSWDPAAQVRYIRDILALAPKGSSKTSYGAGLALTLMLMNKRPRAEGVFIGPTQSISDRAYEQAVGMINLSPVLKSRFAAKEHLKTIVDLSNDAEMRVKTFDLNILTGGILIFALLDELHLLGRNVHTTKVLRQVRGGLDKTPEGLFLMTTTQSDDAPAGAFKDELMMARKIRDGHYRGKTIRALLPVLHEFPDDVAKNPAKWQDPANWHMVMPNLGRSVHLSTLIPDWETEKAKGEKAIRIWASQHLNIEIGIGLKTDAWAGAEFWAGSEDEAITFEYLLEVCDVIVAGLDGGGLDDLYGGAFLGRHKVTKEWLAWSRAWAHGSVLERRQSIASRLLDFKAAGELTICEHAGEDVADIVELIRIVRDRGLLGGVSVDPAGLGEMVEALALIDITVENGLLVGAPQGFGMMTSIKTAERRLENGCVPEAQRKSDLSMRHARSALMDWCVGNVKIEPTATAIRATKQNAGDAKIDPWAALMNAVALMVRNPEPQGSVYDKRDLIVIDLS